MTTPSTIIYSTNFMIATAAPQMSTKTAIAAAYSGGASPRLRPYQLDLKHAVYDAWRAGARVVLAVAPTGAGKTVLFSSIIHEFQVATCAIAHRQELVGQIALALARSGVKHRIIAPADVIRQCQRQQIDELGFHLINPSARVAVAGVDTLLNMDANDPFLASVLLWVGDEGHHFLAENKWGRAVAMFSNPGVRGLLVTATPTRADGKGLGRHADGLADCMVEAPSMRKLIDMGYLTDYVVYVPPSDVDYSAVPIGPSGELNYAKLRAEVHKSKTIVGDVVEHYKLRAMGKLGVTFAVDVEAATEIAAAFRAAGVPAEVVHAKTPPDLRRQIIAKFARRQILQLVNVDLFGEGFDLPAIEVVSMARRTESFSLFAQQFGRALRLMLPKEWALGWDDYDDATRAALIRASNKPQAIILDHVGNIARHNGPPDRPRVWTLDRREKGVRGAPSDGIPYRVCANPNANGTGIACQHAYPRVHVACPKCKHVPEPVARTAPEHVDGNLLMLDSATLAAMYANIGQIWGAPRQPWGVSQGVEFAVAKRHAARQESHTRLRAALEWYGGYVRDRLGVADIGEGQMHFYHTFKIDVGTAQALPGPDAAALADKIFAYLARFGIDAGVNNPVESAEP